MEKNILVNGKMIKRKEKEYIIIKMEINLKVNFVMIKNMKVMDLFIMIIKIFMKEILKKEKKTEKEK